MKHFPDELEFISLFSSEPVKRYNDLPFEYEESTFRFENATETFIVKMRPIDGEFLLEVKNKNDGALIAHYDFKTVGNLEIIKDDKESSKVLLFLDDDRTRFITTVELSFKPKFCSIFKEQFDG
ncbi:hypothetical protein [Priestia abyssalis]|uniref:hypothetical protein n=1 Tax=Priestia abyssalis TaxID=1221450 RepID=UPI0009956B60|nr:hypothetical protein [Priestia abyssalis]